MFETCLTVGAATEIPVAIGADWCILLNCSTFFVVSSEGSFMLLQNYQQVPKLWFGAAYRELMVSVEHCQQQGLSMKVEVDFLRIGISISSE